MALPSPTGINIFRRDRSTGVLHLTWIAFFISFFVWFNHAPLMTSIQVTLGLTDQEVRAILILNVALTIPARVVVGMLVDRLGPRRVYSALLVISGVLCLMFAAAQSFAMLALTRFLLGFVGAGFVVGARMISEWFPAKQVGLAQGIYGGWGNFGSAAAAVALPSVALIFGGDEGWRLAVALTGVVAMIYGAIYYISVTDTPQGATYFKPKKSGALEVTSPWDFVLYLLMQAPMILALGILAWKLGPSGVGLLPDGAVYGAYLFLAALYAYQIRQAYQVNHTVFTQTVPEIHQYKFSQVVILGMTYMVTFGSELAVVSMLPLYLMSTFDLSVATAGLLAGGFAGTNLFARPMGGWLSDTFGRRRISLVLVGGAACGYLLMSLISADTGLVFAVFATLTCSIFVNAGNGSVYAVIPIIKRRLTGQIAGMVGAFGNVGGVLFLTVYAQFSPQVFFLTIAATSLFTFVATLIFFQDPKGAMAEIEPDGSVTMIDVV